jgi:hypothetical protein
VVKFKTKWSSKDKNVSQKIRSVSLCELSTGYDDATYRVPAGCLVTS